MKKIKVLCILSLIGSLLAAHDLYLLPEKFFLKKGGLLTIRMFIGDDFAQEIEKNANKKDVGTMLWITPNGTEDLLKPVIDSLKPVVKQKKMDFTGLGLLAVSRNYFHIELSAEKFTAYLKEERIPYIQKMRDTMPAKKTEREKYTRYIKTLVQINDAHGDQYKKMLGQTLEIILLQNPYLHKAGDKLQAQVFFRGKPLPNGGMEVLCKSTNGKLHKEGLYSDRKGKIMFKINEPGVWMVRITHMLPSATPDADWESFWASYTFGVK